MRVELYGCLGEDEFDLLIMSISLIKPVRNSLILCPTKF